MPQHGLTPNSAGSPRVQRLRPLAARPAATRKLAMNVDGLQVNVTFKANKNMYLRIKEPDGRIEVTAPLRFTTAQVSNFIVQQEPWIRAKQAQILARHAANPAPGQQDPHGSSGGGAPTSGPSSDTSPTGSPSFGAPSPEELAEWRACLQAAVPPLMEKWAPVLHVKPGRITYRNMTSRWGSCNVRTGHITINLQLAAFPPDCLEYVVVHELAHLLEPNHSPRFWAHVESCLPNWKQTRASLRHGIRR